MPSPESISKARFILGVHSARMGANIIHTHAKAKYIALQPGHQCFDGKQVADVLLLSEGCELKRTPQITDIIEMMANYIEMRQLWAPGSTGFMDTAEIQEALDSILLGLENFSTKEARPEVSKSTEES